MMMPYASMTGTKRNLSVMQTADWRLLMSPACLDRYPSDAPRWVDGSPAGHALDNGAWSAHTQGTDFDEPAFLASVARWGLSADWIVLPDVVGGGHASLAYSLSWWPKLAHLPTTLLIAVQDGMVPADVAPYVGPRVGIAVGGSTEWKLSSMRGWWGALSAVAGCHLHILRVNSARRIRLCQDAGAHSFDGSSVTRFASTLPRLDNARRQMPLLGRLNV
jgi:hypothetical protein